MKKFASIGVFNSRELPSSGFTLIEILIASAIFSSVMVMAAGIISQSTTYQERIKGMRETADDARKIADIITRGVREAKGGTTITYAGNNYTAGLMLLSCSSSQCVSAGNTAAETAGVNTLITFSKDSFRIYYSVGNPDIDAKVYVAVSSVGENPGTVIPDLLTNPGSPGKFLARVTTQNNLVTRSSYSTSITFKGFAPDDAHWTHQPYVQFDKIVSKTPNYDTMPVNKRTKMELQSSVVLRNYK